MIRQKKTTNNTMIICLPYDIKDIYPFICRNYGDRPYNEFLKMGYDEFRMKLNSIPETEPLYTIFKSRSINVGKIKDKEQRKYWNELKRENAIPDIYKTNEQINTQIMNSVSKLGGIKNGRYN